jgi:tetratricopeptide (TPR) repeat protein
MSTSTAPADDPGNPPRGIAFTNTGSIHGDVTISMGSRAFRITGFPLARSIDIARLRSQPSRLLAAANSVVPFNFRDGELADLEYWRNKQGPQLAARLLHGPGGQGKTRLAAHFAQLSASYNWAAAMAHHRSEHTRDGQAYTVKDARGLLLMVDYAERWPVDDLLDLFGHLLNHRVVTRVLLLARPDAWWQELTYRLERMGVTADSRPLAPLAGDLRSRQKVFTAACRRFAARDLYDLPDLKSLTPPDELDDPAYGQVLVLHMAALAAVDAAARGAPLPDRRAQISAYLLARERELWRSTHGNRQIDTPPEQIADAVCIAALTRALPYHSAAGPLSRAAVSHPGEATRRLLKDHAFFYPPAQTGTILEPLYPDWLAEDFFAEHARRPGTYDILTGLLAPTAGKLPAYTRVAITFLVETARRWPDVATQQLYPLLRAHPELAIAAGGATLARLAGIPDVETAVLKAIEALLPEGRHVDLDIGAAAITSELARRWLADQAERARLQAAAGNRLANAGDRAQALAATTEAVDIYRKLRSTDPAAFEPKLAESLDDLGNRLSDVGRREEALAATTEAVDIYRELTKADPATFELRLAGALTHLGIRQADLQHWEEALAATHEAVQILRRRAPRDPAAFESDLARSLDGLGDWLSREKRLKEAVTTAAEAITIIRRLAASDSRTFKPQLARALANLGTRLADLWRLDEALSAASEAVSIYRKLARADPATFNPKLAWALTNLGRRRSALGQHRQALKATNEAVRIYRPLARRNSNEFEPDLAWSLSNLGIDLLNLGQLNKAVKTFNETIEIYCRLALGNPDAFEPNLAWSLINLGITRSNLGQHDRAVKVTQEAVDLNRRLAGVNPAVFESNLASSLTHLSERHSGPRRWNKAVAAVDEAIGIYHRLATAGGVEPRLRLARSLRSSAAVRCGGNMHPRQRLAHARESVRILEDLNRQVPRVFKDDLQRARAVLEQIRGKRCGT